MEYKSKFRNASASSSLDKDSGPIQTEEKHRHEKTTNSQVQSKTQLLSYVCTFVDMVPPFRDLATKSMGSMIELQKSQLYELGEFYVE